MRIRVVVSGRNYDAVSVVPESLDLADGATVDDALAALPTALPAGCLVALSGRHLGTLASHQNSVLRDGDELLLIAPVAGG